MLTATSFECVECHGTFPAEHDGGGGLCRWCADRTADTDVTRDCGNLQESCTRRSCDRCLSGDLWERRT